MGHVFYKLVVILYGSFWCVVSAYQFLMISLQSKCFVTYCVRYSFHELIQNRLWRSRHRCSQLWRISKGHQTRLPPI